MTQSTKHYVGLTDLTSIRMSCDHCKASLSLPLRSPAFIAPHQCPSCQSDWYQSYGSGTSAGDLITKLVNDLRLLERVSVGKATNGVGFSLDLEVSELEFYPASSNRDI